LRDSSWETRKALKNTIDRKVIISPKFLRMEWLKEEKLDEVRDSLKHQKLEKFLKLSGNTYLDLVKVF